MDSDKIRYFIPKVINRLANKRSKVWQYVNVKKWSLKGFYASFKTKNFLDQLCAMLGKYDSSIFSTISTGEKKMIIELAQQAIRHEFDLLGSGKIVLDPIDWHTDFKSGFRWSKIYYYQIELHPGSDIKVPWELSRCQHLLWLGEAYLFTGAPQYAQEIMDEISWWIDDNPLMYTVNWKCSMEVAFRAVNWMFALNMISSYVVNEEQFVEKVAKSLFQHGFFIRNNLEKVIPKSNNHYASNIVGLLYLGCLFNDTTTGKSWRDFANHEFINEVRQQVFPSGVHYENSVSYHRMMTEMLSYPLYMLQRLNYAVPDDVYDRINAMYAYVATYTKPNSLAPLLADNDDGRFLPFIRRDFRQHGYLFDKNSLENRIIGKGVGFLFTRPMGESRFYDEIGVAILKSNNCFYILINNSGYSCTPNPTKAEVGTHTHNDQLSFELNINGQDLIVDAGAYLYTSSIKKRDEFRKTSKHNTIVVDEEEQNEFVAPFVLKRNVAINGLNKICDSRYSGEYMTIKGQMHHKRLFEIENNKLYITDIVTKKGDGHQVKAYFHLGKDVIATQIANNKVILNVADYSYVLAFSQTPVRLDICDDTISPSYGVLVNTKTIIATYQFNNKINFKTSIV